MSAGLSQPVARPGILDIAAYVPGKEHVDGIVKLYKLSSNEMPLSPSPKVIEAFGTVASHLEIYPDNQASADVHGLDIANIMCGNGSDELFGLLCYVYLGADDEAFITEHGFLVYKIQIIGAGAIPVTVKEKDCTVDMDAILVAGTPKTKMVFVSNPRNLTDTYVPVAQICRLQAGLPKHVVLVLDAAYAEYVCRNDYEASLELVFGNHNVLMTRTFFKVYGLAALRVGWMYSLIDIIDALNRVRGPSNMCAPAIAAGAAAIRDQACVEKAVAHNTLWMEKLVTTFTCLDLTVTPSVTNFIRIYFLYQDGKRTSDADEFLSCRGYILRTIRGYGFQNALRMTVGSEGANLGVIAALPEFMGQA